MTEIAGRAVLVTGAASGLGRLMAQRFAAQGSHPILWDVDRENLERVRADLEAASGRRVRAHVCDVSRREEVYRAAEQVKREAGPVDVLVNNAGVVSGRRLLELPDEKIELTFGVNTLALFWTAKAFLPDMVERNRGHVVTIASASGLIGVAQLADYSASKWAAVGFDESLRSELRRVAPGVRTTVVCPFYVATGMFEGVKSRFPFLLPILRPEDVAARVVRAVARGQRRVTMPWIVHTVPLLRVLPVPVFDAVADFLGVNVSMEEFVGRGRAEPRPGP